MPKNYTITRSHMILIVLQFFWNAGASDDWALGAGGFQYSYTIELPPAKCNIDPNECSYGFELPASEILSVGKEQYAGLVAMLEHLQNKGFWSKQRGPK